jgi:hypothetical protein
MRLDSNHDASKSSNPATSLTYMIQHDHIRMPSILSKHLGLLRTYWKASLAQNTRMQTAAVDRLRQHWCRQNVLRNFPSEHVRTSSPYCHNRHLDCRVYKHVLRVCSYDMRKDLPVRPLPDSACKTTWFTAVCTSTNIRMRYQCVIVNRRTDMQLYWMQCRGQKGRPSPVVIHAEDTKTKRLTLTHKWRCNPQNTNISLTDERNPRVVFCCFVSRPEQ